MSWQEVIVKVAEYAMWTGIVWAIVWPWVRSNQ